MTGLECRDAIVSVGLSQVAAARFFRVDDSTVRRWLAEKLAIPEAVVMLLRVMLHFHLSPEDIERITRRVAP